jgi:hypothetical protein
LNFDPWNRSLKFWESTRTPWELHWECDVSLPHTFLYSLTLSGICDVTPGLLLGPHPCGLFALTPILLLGSQPCNPFVLFASPKLGLRQHMWSQRSFDVDYLGLGLFSKAFWLLYVKKCDLKGQWNNWSVFLLCLLVLILRMVTCC